jgi:hypothetical protein
MPNVGRAIVLLALVLGTAGCARFKEVSMVDPRTGVKAVCRSERTNAQTTGAAVQEVNACMQELTYYGFQDEEALLAAARPIR